MQSPPDNSGPPPVAAVEPAGPVPALSLSGLASLVTFAGFAGFLTIGSLTQLANIPFGLWWTEAFIFFGVPYVLMRLSGREPLQSTGFTRPWAAGCAFGFALGLTNFFAVVAPIQYVATKLAPKDLLELYDASKVFQDKSPLELAFIIGGVCIAAPIAEETFFRGVLQRGWGERLKPVAAVIVTGAVFSAFHLDPIGFPARWELGILFGLLALRTGSLWPGIFAHLANNLTSTVLFFALKDEKQDPTDDFTAILAIAGIGGIALLLVLLTGRRFPGTLTSPQPARETRIPAAKPTLALGWAAAGLLAFAVLIIVDPRGAVVRGIDMVVPVKVSTAELRAQREQAMRGELSFGQYWAARSTAKPGSGSGSGSASGAGTEPGTASGTESSHPLDSGH